MNEKKIIYLEKIRVFALFMVLYTHSDIAGVLYFQNAATTAGYWFSLFFFRSPRPAFRSFS